MKLIKNDTVNAIMERRSIRGYTDEPVSEDELYTILQCGLWAPSGRNSQTTKFFVLRDKAAMERLQKEALESTENPSKWLSGGFYYNAPCLVFLYGKNGDRWSEINAAIAVENMHIAAQSLGLGSIILGIIKDYMLSEKGEEWKKYLGVPEGYDFVIALAVGHKAVEGKALPRDDGDIVYKD